MAQRVVILGSTGSVGTSTLDVVRHYRDRLDVVALAAHSNDDLLFEQIQEFRPEVVALEDSAAASRLEARHPRCEVWSGTSGVEALGGVDAEVVVCAIVGAAGLRAVLRAIDAGSRIAMANKEPLVMAGGLITARALEKGVQIIPVDSEHSAIFQCLVGHRSEEIHRIHLTASGGPFYGRARGDLASVTPEEAMAHPTWDMGAKISVDSATLMNKGLEVIEAMVLFGLDLDQIRVIIHPQSVVHGLVEFVDGSILAQLGATDMKLPIQFALTWPERVQSCVERLDLAALSALEFEEPNFSQFPCLGLALEAARLGGTAPATLNAANEVAVEAFCKHRISFLEISEVVERVLGESDVNDGADLESIFEADAAARIRAEAMVEEASVNST